MRAGARRRWPATLVCALGAVALAACGGAAVPPAPPDAGVAPDPDPVGAPLAVIVEALDRRAAEAAAALPGGRALVQTQGALLWVQTGTVSRVEGAVGRLAGAAALAGALVVAGEAGIAVLEAGALRPSPLQDALPGFAARQLLFARPGGRAVLWLAGPGGLVVWSDGALRAVDPDPLPSTGCVMAFGAPIDGQPALWLACEGTLYGLLEAGDAYQAHRQPDVPDPAHLAVDGEGTLWVVTAGGAVWSRGLDGAWRPHDFTAGATGVRAAPGAEEVWFETMDGLWRFDQLEFRPVAGLEGARLLAASGPGRALASSPQGLLRVNVGLRVDLDGLEDGALLAAPTTVRAYPLRPETVVAVRATVDDAPVEVQDGLRIVLDPAAFIDGTHTLVVTADHGSEQAQSSLRFSRYAGPPPTWRGEVQPLFAARCALCHGAQGSARRLDSAPTWAAQIDSILDNVRAGRMPLPPNPALTTEEVARVEGWAAAGFPEGE